MLCQHREIIHMLSKARTFIFDYDGTLAPLNVRREESSIHPELKEVLRELAKKRTIVIATTKDCNFIRSRTEFAHIWVCSNGFEVQINELSIMPTTIFDKVEKIESFLDEIHPVVQKNNIIIERKRVGPITIGICIDWRFGSIDPAVLEGIIARAERLGLTVIRYPGRPFIDIFVDRIDKGWALKKLIELGMIEKPMVYFGDSENDIPAFRVVDIGIFVVHDENRALLDEIAKIRCASGMNVMTLPQEILAYTLKLLLCTL